MRVQRSAALLATVLLSILLSGVAAAEERAPAVDAAIAIASEAGLELVLVISRVPSLNDEIVSPREKGRAGLESIAKSAELELVETDGVLTMTVPAARLASSPLSWRRGRRLRQRVIAPDDDGKTRGPVELHGVELRLLLETLSIASGAQLRARDPLDRERIHLSMPSIAGWPRLLPVLARELEAELHRDAEGAIDIRPRPHVSINCDDTPAVDVIRQIVKAAGVNCVIPSSIEGIREPVSLTLEDIDWEDALELVLSLIGLVAVDQVTGEMICIVRAPPPAEDTVTLTLYDVRDLEEQASDGFARLVEELRADASPEERFELTSGTLQSSCRSSTHELIQSRLEELRRAAAGR